MNYLVALFKIVLSLSFMGSILAIVIILIKSIFKNKLNAHWHYYVWLLLIIRLIIPFTPESPLSMFNLLHTGSQTIEMAQDINPAIEIATNNLLSPKNNNFSTIKDNFKNVSNITSSTINNVSKKENIIGLNYYTLSVIWLIGVILMFLYFIIVNMKLHVKINKGLECKEEAILRKFDECKLKMNIYSCIPIVYCDKFQTPTLFGMIRPRLLIPQKVINSLSEEEKGYVFLHELAHLKRKDILINWITVLVQSLHWFNPIVWYAINKIHGDCEMACDAYVLSRLNPVEHKKYGETIINLIKEISESYWNPITIGMANNKSNIKRRIVMITRFKKSTLIWSAIAIVLVIGITIIGLTGAKDNTSKRDNTNNQSKKTIATNKDSQGNTVKPTTSKSSDIDSQSANNQKSNLYTNNQYGFSFSLPDSWKGYTIVNDKWEGLSIGGQNGESVVETGPMLSIRHPQWTAQNPRQDIPIMVFTLDQWNSLKQVKFHIGAAPIPPSELGRNSKYVFALPARYNYSFLEGYKEVESILSSKPLQTIQ